MERTPMATLSTEPLTEDELIAQRKAWGGDRWDEVWDGVYFMSPLPNIEHQIFVARLTSIFQAVVDAGNLGIVFAGVNVSDRADGWTHNYRCPDVAVVLPGCPAQNCDTHWYGGPDFVVEIVSPDDRSRKKFDFYAKVGVREILLVDRAPWALELYVLDDGEFRLAGQSTPDSSLQLQSTVLPL
ncbi:MAG TPA: Uma2 family endonuclease, partial [Planctomycetaceae bacterium]